MRVFRRRAGARMVSRERNTMTRTYQIDSSHSHVGFSIRHLVIAKVRGEFGKVNATIELDEQSPSRSSVRAEIAVASIDTREEKRDAHLRSADFFDAEKFPTMTFVSNQVLLDRDKIARVIGDLTIRDITRQVTLEVEDLGRVKDPWGSERAAFSAKTRINRRDFGLTWNVALEAGGVLVGDTVDISLELEAVAAAAQQAA
jgi:polyisoprenoid-binding protein YceI